MSFRAWANHAHKDSLRTGKPHTKNKRTRCSKCGHSTTKNQRKLNGNCCHQCHKQFEH